MRITRRQALSLVAAPALARSAARLAITMDDVNWQAIPAPYGAGADERILDAMGKHQAALFVVGQYVDSEDGKKILDRWDEAGHLLGNHTYTHKPLHSSTPEEFEQDLIRNEAVLSPYRHFTRLFRFPVLKEGETREIRDEIRRYLRDRGYRNGAVTVDASDWYYDSRLRDRLKKEPAFDVNRFREPYLAHLWERAQYYDQLSRTVLGRSVAHTLLIHYNLINALFLKDALRFFSQRGWGIIGAEEAFADPVFRSQPDTVPAGESLLWALASESGKFEGKLRYPGEDGDYEKPKLDRLGL